MSIYIYKFYYIVYIVQQTVTVKPSYSIDIWTNGVFTQIGTECMVLIMTSDHESCDLIKTVWN